MNDIYLNNKLKWNEKKTSQKKFMSNVVVANVIVYQNKQIRIQQSGTCCGHSNTGGESSLISTYFMKEK